MLEGLRISNLPEILLGYQLRGWSSQLSTAVAQTSISERKEKEKRQDWNTSLQLQTAINVGSDDSINVGRSSFIFGFRWFKVCELVEPSWWILQYHTASQRSYKGKEIAEKALTNEEHIWRTLGNSFNEQISVADATKRVNSHKQTASIEFSQLRFLRFPDIPYLPI